MSDRTKYIAFLRGINLGAYHKVPMADLRREMENMGFQNVKTFLNSGNVLFEGNSNPESTLEEKISSHLEKVFDFEIPVIVRNSEEIKALTDSEPFKNVEITDDIRLYITYLKDSPEKKPNLPWHSDDNSFRITEIRDKAVCSVLDLSKSSTPKGMEKLEKLFGKDITTRNWNTLHRIVNKL